MSKLSKLCIALHQFLIVEQEYLTMCLTILILTETRLLVRLPTLFVANVYLGQVAHSYWCYNVSTAVVPASARGSRKGYHASMLRVDVTRLLIGSKTCRFLIWLLNILEIRLSWWLWYKYEKYFLISPEDGNNASTSCNCSIKELLAMTGVTINPNLLRKCK